MLPGSTVKYSGLGDNFFASLPRGDLYVKVNIEANPEFGVDNIDLHKNIDIDCVQAMVGGTVVVTGLDGKRFDINIPAGTQPGTRFRLAEQGLYAMNQNIRGNMLINVKITVPANLTPEQQQGVRNLFNIQ